MRITTKIVAFAVLLLVAWILIAPQVDLPDSNDVRVMGSRLILTVLLYSPAGLARITPPAAHVSSLPELKAALFPHVPLTDLCCVRLC